MESQRLLFYSSLRKDDLVRRLGAEQKIRDLTEKLILYDLHANEALCTLQDKSGDEYCGNKVIDESIWEIRFRMEEVGIELDDNPEIPTPFEKLVAAIDSSRQQPMCMDFSDIQQIAYTIGTYEDPRPLWKRMIRAEDPLENLAGEYARRYDNLVNVKDADLSYLEPDAADAIRSAMVSEDMPGLTDAANRLAEISAGYIYRKAALLQLSGLRDNILDYYYPMLRDSSKGCSGDCSCLEAGMPEDKLTLKDLLRIPGYLKNQSNIDNIMFWTLLAYLSVFRNRYRKK